jgi:MFS family permease
VFAAVFILFRPRTQGIATTIARIMAVLAPTVGPVIGGWITQVYSWHWLFLINVIPGVDCVRRHAVSLTSEKYQFRRSRARWLVTVSIGGRAHAWRSGSSSRRKMDGSPPSA